MEIEMITFKIRPHSLRSDNNVIEIWYDNKFIRIISKYLMGVQHEDMVTVINFNNKPQTSHGQDKQ